MRARWIFACVALCAIVAGVGLSIAVAGGRDSLDGRWVLVVNTSQWKGAPVLSLKADRIGLTGTYSSYAIGNAPVVGAVHGHRVRFEVNDAAAQRLIYDGSLDGKSMRGTISIPPIALGDFVAYRSRVVWLLPERARLFWLTAAGG